MTISLTRRATLAVTALATIAVSLVTAPAASAYSGTIDDAASCGAAGGTYYVYSAMYQACEFRSFPFEMSATEQLTLEISTRFNRGGSFAGQVTSTAPVDLEGHTTNSGEWNASRHVYVHVNATLTNSGTMTSTFYLWVKPGGTLLVTDTGVVQGGGTGVIDNDGTIVVQCGGRLDSPVNGNPPVHESCTPTDTTPPTLDPTVTPDPVLLNGTATASPGESDASGIASSSCTQPVTSSVGLKTVECTATDTAGNTATASKGYQVLYGFSGFAAPVDAAPTVNTAKAGQTIPLQWTLTDATGTPVPDLTTATITARTTNCSSTASTDPVESYTTAGTSGLQNLGGGTYQLNWKSLKSDAGTCKTLQLDLGEGTPRTALFQFR